MLEVDIHMHDDVGRNQINNAPPVIVNVHNVVSVSISLVTIYSSNL
jgi:hypothetical protein